jgi:nucleotide-binding universal stress UspA family protein
MLLVGAAAHEAIARAAARERADVIVIGTHGRSGLERVFVGSVAARVIGTAPCPVLTVRPRRGRKG